MYSESNYTENNGSINRMCACTIDKHKVDTTSIRYEKEGFIDDGDDDYEHRD